MSRGQGGTRSGSRVVRTVKVPARKLPSNKALIELMDAAQKLIDAVDDIEVRPIKDARQKLEDALGPFNRTANELG